MRLTAGTTAAPTLSAFSRLAQHAVAEFLMQLDWLGCQLRDFIAEPELSRLANAECKETSRLCRGARSCELRCDTLRVCRTAARTRDDDRKLLAALHADDRLALQAAHNRWKVLSHPSATCTSATCHLPHAACAPSTSRTLSRVSPSPSWPLEHPPHAYTTPLSRVTATVCQLPAATSATFLPISVSTSLGAGWSCLSPCPRRKLLPRPHE